MASDDSAWARRWSVWVCTGLEAGWIRGGLYPPVIGPELEAFGDPPTAALPALVGTFAVLFG
jgi:hypothetical protein